MDHNRQRPTFPGTPVNTGFRSSLSSSQSLPRNNPLPESPGVSSNQHTFGINSKQVTSPQPFSPSPQPPQSPDPVHDLPNELLEAGWRRFWSKREGREYFFNKFSKQSAWEMPTLGSPSGPSRHDPLGIQIDTPRPANLSPGAAVVAHKRPSMDAQPLSPVIKNLELKGAFWAFDINSNAVMYERLPSVLPPPHNDMEILRSTLVTKLRHHYQELCTQREGIDSPRESFNRWLLERKVVDKGNDPLLPSNCPSMVSPSMKREIMSDIPIRLYRPKLHSQARKLVSSYAEAAKKLIDSRNATPESRKVVKWTVEDVFKWLRTQPSCSIDDYMKRLSYLKEQCGPHLCEAAKPSVEGICIKMYQMAVDFAINIRQKHWDLLKEHQIEAPPPLTRPPADKKMPCYPVHCIVPSPRLPAVEHHEEGDTSCIRYKGEMMKLNSAHLKKLNVLYKLNCRDDPTQQNFLPRVWCLLRRYQTLFGVGQYEGHGLQGALPVSVFKVLNQRFGVTFECFASPLNCYFKQYCSAFGDTDCFFGSRGPILDFNPTSGSFEANPPFGEELMEEMVNHFEDLLKKTQDPLSFIVFIPDWRNPPTEALVRMEKSRFKRRQKLIPAYEHEYRSGGQHTCKETDVYYRAVHGTLVVFLQNDAGYNAWTPTDESMELLLDAYKPQAQSKRKAEDDDTPEDASPEKKRRMSESGVPNPALANVKDSDILSRSDGLLSRQSSNSSIIGAVLGSDNNPPSQLKRKAEDDDTAEDVGPEKKMHMSDFLEQSPVTSRRGSSMTGGLAGADRKSNNGDEAEQMSPVTARRGSSVSSISSGSPVMSGSPLTWPTDIGTSKRKVSSSDNSDFSPMKRNREDSLSSPPLLKSGSESDSNMPNKRTHFAAIPPPPPSKWSKIKDSPQQKNKITEVTPPQNFFKKRPGLGFGSPKKNNEEETPKKAPPVDPFDFDEEEDSTPTQTPTKSESQTKQSRTSRNNSGNSRMPTRELRSRRR